MTEFFVQLPGYYDEIAELLARADWLVHNFHEPDPEGLYNPANYLHNIEIEGVEYRAFLDLNVQQFIVNCLKKDKPHPNYRTACALLVFCRMCDIQLEPAPAAYERINYNTQNLAEAVTEVELLRTLDNTDVDILAEYALGHIDHFRNVGRVDVRRDIIGAQLTQYRRLKHWDSIYLLVLGVVSVYWNDRIKRRDKLGHYVDWMLREFRLSLPCVVYAVRLLGKDPLSKMMKYRPDRSEHLRRTAIFNMTWDLFHIDHFFKMWTDPEKSWEALFFTHDRVLKAVMRLAISVQYSGDLSPMTHHLSRQNATTLRALINQRDQRIDRIYGTDAWTPEHRARKITILERELFA